MTLDEKLQEAFKLVGAVTKDPDEMTATEVREAYKKLVVFVTGLLVGSVLTYDKVKEVKKVSS